MSLFHTRSRLARKIAVAAFAISLCCTIVSSGILIFVEFEQGQKKIEKEIRELGRTNVGSIALGLWVVNTDLVTAQLKGLAQLPFISYARVRYEEGEIVSGKASPGAEGRPFSFDLVYDKKQGPVQLGVLSLSPDYGRLKGRLSETALKIFLAQFVLATSIALAVFLLFFRLVGRHIEAIAGQAETLSPENLEQFISLGRQREGKKPDELDVLETALNSMRINLKHSIQELRKKDEQHRTLFQTMHQGVLYVDGRGRLITANPAALRILDLSSDRMEKGGAAGVLEPCIHEDATPVSREDHPVFRALNQKEPVTGVVLGLTPHETQAVQWLSVTATPLFREGEKTPYQVHVTFEDITRRKKAEDILLRYEQIISATDELMSFVDDRYIYRAVNNAYLKAFQKEREEIVGHAVPDLMGEALFAETVKIQLDKALAGETVSYQKWFEYKGLGRRYMKVVHHPFADRSGRITGVVVCVHDLTEIKEAETALIESELKYKTLFDNMAQGVFYQQADGVIVDFNAKALEMFGLRADQLMGKSAFDPEWHVVRDDERFCPPEDHPSIRALRTGQAVRDEVVGVFNPVTQSRRWLNINAIPQFRGPARDPFQVFVTMHDITDLRQAEADLHESHERFLTVLNSIDAFIHVSEFTTHKVLFMNQAMKTHFGADHTGRVCYEVFKNRSEPCPGCTDQFLRDESGQPMDVHVYTGQDRVTGKWYINHDRAIRWTGGRIVRLHIATDITELKKMESDLRQAQKMESIGTLAGGVAHDFNNILSIILGNAELAMDEAASWHPVHAHIKEIKTASLRARGVIRQLLNFSRKTEYEQVSLDLAKAVKESLTLMRSSIPANIKIISTIPEGDFRITADPSQLHQVLMNLCTNAAQAMPEKGGTIEVRLDRARIENRQWKGVRNLPQSRYLEVVVRDNGPGIPVELMERIFDPYFTTKDVGEGTGLGLAVVQGIVQNHNGFLHVESDSGKGACFFVLLPEGEGPVSTEETAAGSAQVSGQDRHILVVDDEKGVAEVTRNFLERLGYRVDVETDPVRAAAMVKQAPDRYDLLVTDLTMPGMNGLALAEGIRKISSGMPVIVCTGHGPQVDEERAKDLDIFAFATKPLTLMELSKLVQGAMNELQNPGESVPS